MLNVLFVGLTYLVSLVLNCLLKITFMSSFTLNIYILTFCIMIKRINARSLIVTTCVLALTLLSFPSYSQIDSKDYYTPKAMPTPLHNQSHQLHISAGYGLGYDINISYSLPYNWFLFSTGTRIFGTKSRTAILGSHYHITKDDYVVSGGLGYSLLRKENYIFESLFGLGKNSVNNNWSFDILNCTTYTNANYKNLFLQFNFTRQINALNFGISSRISYSFYDNMEFFTRDYSMSISSNYENYQIVNMSVLSIEPSLFVGFKIYEIIINCQAGFPLPVSNREVELTTTWVNDFYPPTTRKVSLLDLFVPFARISAQFNFNLKKSVDK